MTPKKFKTILLCQLGLFFLASSAALADEKNKLPAEIITISADEWCPYNCSQKEGYPGFMIEIAKAAFKLSNIDVTYKPSNWSRTIKLVKDGKIDGGVGVTEEEARSENFAYGKEPMGQSSFVFVVRKDEKWRFTGPESLPKIRFGIIQDYDNGPVINTYMATKPGNVVTQVGSDGFKKNMKLVLAGRINAAIEDGTVAAYELSTMGLADKTKFVALDEEPLPVSIGFTPGPKGERLASILDAGIQKLRSTGQLAKILARYGLKDWK